MISKLFSRGMEWKIENLSDPVVANKLINRMAMIFLKKHKPIFLTPNFSEGLLTRGLFLGLLLQSLINSGVHIFNKLVLTWSTNGSDRI